MSNKFNSTALNDYSRAFARRVVTDFYQQNPVMSGRQILNLTRIAQINLFTIHSLQEKWRSETERLRSPYFDFSHPDVQEALQQFMNVVSQHIAVRREQMEPLLCDATKRTIELLFDPRSYFDDLLRSQPDFTLTLDNIRQITRFTQINKFVPTAIEQRMNGKSFVYVNQALQYLDEILTQRAPELERPERFIDMFSEQVPMDLPALLRGQTLETIANTPTRSFFDAELDAAAPAANAAPEPARDEPAPVGNRFRSSPPAESQGQAPAPAEAASSVNGSHYVPEVPAPAEATRPAVAQTTDNVAMAPAGTPAATTVNDVARPTESIAKSISLNQKFRFINQLFNGSTQAFNHALEELDELDTFEQATDVVSYRYASQYNWDMNSEEVGELLDILKRRFAPAE